MVLASLIRQNGGRLGILSDARFYHGRAELCHGQRNLNVYKRARLALPRPHQ